VELTAGLWGERALSVVNGFQPDNPTHAGSLLLLLLRRLP